MAGIQDTKAALLAILGDRVVAYHPLVARALGGATVGILFSQLFYWTGRGADPDGWIYKTQAEITEETALTRWEQETARKKLKALGVLEEKYQDMPRRLYFRVDVDKAIELMQAYLDENNDPKPARRGRPRKKKKAARKQDAPTDPAPEESPVKESPPEESPADPAKPRPVGAQIRAERVRAEEAIRRSRNPQAILATWASWVSGEPITPSAIGGLVKRMAEAAPYRFARHGGTPNFKTVCVRLVPLVAQAAVDAPPDKPFIGCLYRFLEDWAEIPHLGPQTRARDRQAAQRAVSGEIRLVCPVKAVQPTEVLANA